MDKPVLSIFERAKVLAARKQHLCNGGVSTLVQAPGETLDGLVRRELVMGLIPFKLARFMPDGTTRVYKLADMVISTAPSAPLTTLPE
jgi:hypothetical protein